MKARQRLARLTAEDRSWRRILWMGLIAIGFYVGVTALLAAAAVYFLLVA